MLLPLVLNPTPLPLCCTARQVSEAVVNRIILRYVDRKTNEVRGGGGAAVVVHSGDLGDMPCHPCRPRLGSRPA